MKKQDSCPNSHQTIVELNENDRNRLHCSLYTVDKVMIKDLQRCEIENNVLEPGRQYLIKMQWLDESFENLP